MEVRGYRVDGDGLVLSIRLTPRASRDAIDGIGCLSDGTAVIQARVRPPPADGAANAAVIKLLAKSLKVRKSAVHIVSGQTARLKQVRVTGDPSVLAEVIDQWPSTS